MCEQKFKEYCENEQFFSHPDVKVEDETETSSYHSNNDDNHLDEVDENKEIIENTTKYIKKEKPECITEVPIINSSQNIKSLQIEDKTTIKDKTPVKKQKTTNEKDAVRKLINTSKKEIITIQKPHIIQETIGNVSKYSCKQCGASFNTIKLIGDHLVTEHRAIFKCEHCPKILNSYKILLNHLKRHEKRQRVKFNKQCTRCPRIFSTKDSFVEHMQLHLSHNRYPICDICKKRFKNKRILSIHLNLHLGTNKKCLCDICGWGFNDATNLRAHVNTVHLKLKPYVCKLCNKAYATKRPYIDHMTKHRGKEETFSCSTCSWESTNEKRAQVHILKHTNKFMCKICPKIFDDPKSRRRHVFNYHASKFTCTICGVGLSSQYCLDRHLEIHNGIKKFECKICGMKFSQKSGLNRHSMRVHNPESVQDHIVKTKCEICKRSFKNIEVHLERHRVRNFKCEICGQSYASNSTLNRHKTQKHIGRRFYCEVCNKKYLQKSKLNTHMNKVHGIKVEKKVPSVDDKKEIDSVDSN
ncbi:zinc finger protein OZF-like isoform X2 [Spodoptera litura]|nr:zinc finger protein OZF-like isoform X2 [Spodoptera litura]